MPENESKVLPHQSTERLNAYYCEDCRGYVVTVDRDEGVTPMFLACRVKGEPNAPGNDCKGMSRSMMYPSQPWPPTDGLGQKIPTKPTYEWYSPDEAERARLLSGEPETYDHVAKGGLLLRRIGSNPPPRPPRAVRRAARKRGRR